MSGVFISYRRDDSKGFAGALLRELNQRLGADQVFMDIEDIEGGTDFPSVLREAVTSCDVLLALIGARWLDARNAQGGRRLDDPGDFVRQEIALALQGNARVIPVLVDGAAMPAADMLPPDLQALARRNALELSNSHWDEDVARLTDHIREGLYALGVEKAAGARPAPDFSAIPAMSTRVKQVVIAALGFGLVFAALGLGLGIRQARWEALSQRAVAQVVRQVSDGDDLYSPELRFPTPDGGAVSFVAGTAANPPAYALGEKVTVLYDPAKPEQAVIDSFMARWFMPLLFAGFGLIWLVIGVAPLILRGLRRRKLVRLLARGRPIITAYHGVEENTHITVQGRHPYIVLTEWRNPVSKELVLFRSHQVWEDPAEKARNRMITVVVDPDNFREYVMDLSFLNTGTAPPKRVL